jgi:hypothetical protein
MMPNRPEQDWVIALLIGAAIGALIAFAFNWLLGVLL